MTRHSVVELQRMVFAALDELCSTLTDAEWATPTECPGWDVKDNLSHIIGTESSILSRPAPEHAVDEKPWVKNPIGAGNEIQVDYRRSWPPSKVLDEYREIVAERMGILGPMADEDLDGESWTPVGPGKVRDLVSIRVMDCWVHEQDIRRAIGRPGGLDGPVAAHAFERHSSAIPFVVGKKAAAPDGSTVVVDVEGYDSIAVGVEGKRANRLDAAPTDPTVTLRMDLETFNRLCCGRGDPSEVGAKVKVDGDTDLGQRIIDNFAFMI